MRRMRIIMMRNMRMSIMMRKNMRMTMLMKGSESKINLSGEFRIIIIIISQRWAQTESGSKSNVGSNKNGPEKKWARTKSGLIQKWADPKVGA